MSEKWCSKCGAELPADSAELCRKCVLLLALDTDDDATPALAGVVDHAVSALGVKLRYFGDFELIEEIARGGMGVVFRAHQISLNRTVAIKLIASDRLTSPDARKRFAIEAEAAANLDHPNIVPIYERGEHEGMPYLCMRLIEGEDLAKHLRSRTGDSSDQQKPHDFCYENLMAKVARAVHYAHSRGFLHRDLKPSNIVLDKDGEPYVTDFGLAKHVDAEAEITRTAAIMGTPHYMSPEQCQGKASQVSVRSDVFSLAIILYELLSGKVPFGGDSTLEVMQEIASAEPVRPLKEVHRDLDTICRKALEKEPERRYASALALAEDLECWLKGQPIAARSVGNSERTWKWMKRNPALAISVAAGVMALLLGTVLSLWQAHEARQAAERERAMRFDLAANLYASDMHLAQQEVDAERFSSARARLKRHIPEPGATVDLRGWEWRWLWQATEPSYERVFVGHELPVTSMVIAADENRILSGSYDGIVNDWNLATGKRRELLNLDEEIHELAISADGQWLAVSTWHTVWEPFNGEMTTKIYDLEGSVPVKLPREVRSNWRMHEMRFVELPEQPPQLLFGKKVQQEGRWHLWDFTNPEEESLALFGPISDDHVFTASNDGRQVALVETHPENVSRISVANTITQETNDIVWDGEMPVHELAFAPSGRRIALLTKFLEDDAITSSAGVILDLSDGSVVLRTPVIEQAHSSIAMIDDDTLITVDATYSMHVWRPNPDHPGMLSQSRTLHGHSDDVRVRAAPSGSWIATASHDKTVGQWRLDLPDSIHTSRTRHTRSYPLPIAISADGQIIAANAGNIEEPQQVTVWNHRTSSVQHQIQGMPLHLSPEGTHLKTWHYQTPESAREGAYAGFGSYSAMTVSAIEHWDLTQSSAVSEMIIPIHPPLLGVCAGSSSLDGRKFAAGTVDGTVAIIDTDTGAVQLLTNQVSQGIAGTAISPDHRFAAFTGRTAGLYDVTANRLIRMLAPALEYITNPVFSDDSRFLAHSPSDGSVLIYSLIDPLADPIILRSSESEVRCLAFSPDGKTLAASHGSAVVRFWNVATWQEMGQMHSNWYVKFSADGRCFLTDGNFERPSSEGRITIRETPLLSEIRLK